MAADHEPLEMRIELTVIEDLGIKLYGTLPPVISEMVANAWDADASFVEITLEEDAIDADSTIVVRDDGHGMSYEDIQEKYLSVGRKRRVKEGTDLTVGGRRVMGRKGIGKLSVFGIAKRVQVRTVSSKKASVFQMDLGDLLSEAQESGTYKPRTISADVDADEGDGTTVTLTHLTRKNRISVQSIRRGIAKHFSVIGDGFRVSVNGEPISHSDKFRESDWEVRHTINEPLIEDKPEWVVSGWIGATSQPLDEEDRGVTITARGKLIQSPTMFGIKSGKKFSYSYLAGEIRAEFFDEQEDHIATNRQSLIWDTPQGAALMEWGAAKLGEISAELVEKRKAAREKAIREDPEISSWLATLKGHEVKVANKIIRIVTSDEKTGDVERKELVRYARASFEQSAFLEMVSTLDEHPDPAAMLDLFKECNVVEAREMERIVMGRLEAIKRLVRFVDENAKEVPTLHDYFKDSPWMLEPTWTQWQHEKHFSDLLKDNFPDEELEETDRRIDFLSIGVGDTVHVVELKRPGYRVKDRDLVQLTKYVGFVKDRLGNVHGRGYADAAGYLVVGKRSTDSGTREFVQMAEKSRQYIKTYEDLITDARRLHRDFEEKLEEFEKARLQAHAEQQA
ncbi:MAG: ATP-binding protein [Thaumarchaeota archaeon]|nr:ATP-binding protein [Nitrososphaerota archaeon]